MYNNSEICLLTITCLKITLLCKFKYMETGSPNVFRSPTSSDSLQGSGSSKVKIRLSEIRYTPVRTKDSGLATFMLDICQDSLEIPRPRSKLIEFTQIIDGEDTPRHIIMPLFFNSKQSPSHQRQASLKHINRSKPNTITDLLQNLREKPKPKSSLKHSDSGKKQKTVSFCSQLELSSPDTLANSVIYVGNPGELEDSLEKIEKSVGATTANSDLHEHWKHVIEKAAETATSTLQNAELHDENEIIFENPKEFHFEQEVRSSLANKEIEFNEFSTVAFCGKCEKEIVTAVSYEKIKGQGCVDVTEWILCWVFPACMYTNKKLVHKCPLCNSSIS